MRVILMGPQGAGKGTQAAKLEEETGATHIETGDLVRSEIKQETELGQKIKEYSDKGELVPDKIIIDMTKPYLDENDSWSFLAPLGDLIQTGPTGTNVVDLVVLLAARRSGSRGL